jgi:predicted metal-binding membrane protein
VSSLEWVLKHDRTVIATGLIVITLLCWMWIVPMARDMSGAMNGPSAWMMTTTWDGRHLVLLWAMWAVMMAGMMLPSASPLLLMYAGLLRRRPFDSAKDRPSGSAQGRERTVPLVYAMAAGYLIVWALFSAAATVIQRVLSGLLVLSPMMEMASRPISAAVLVGAGIYQLTPFKWRCLRACRSPLAFIMQHWREGSAGALRMGVEHGIYCLGCCWALMLLLFVGGVMNLYVIVTLTLLVLIEKLAPAGRYVSGATGVILIALGVLALV